jgi:hypothetical protein
MRPKTPPAIGKGKGIANQTQERTGEIIEREWCGLGSIFI